MKKPPQILYIDGNADACEILEILMRNRGFEVVCSHSASDALNAVKNTSFSAIVSEYVLSDSDALDLCAELRKINPDTPIVFYSTEARTEHRARGLSAGAQAYLVKPNDLDFIEKTIMELAV